MGTFSYLGPMEDPYSYRTLFFISPIVYGLLLDVVALVAWLGVYMYTKRQEDGGQGGQEMDDLGKGKGGGGDAAGGSETLLQRTTRYVITVLSTTGVIMTLAMVAGDWVHFVLGWLLVLPMGLLPFFYYARVENAAVEHDENAFRHFYRNQVVNKIKAQPKQFGARAAALTLFLLFAVVFFDGMCWGTQPVHLSTRFTRAFEPDFCPATSTAPCLVYITAAPDMSSSVIVNYQTTETIEKQSVDSFVYYDTVSRGNVTAGSTPPHAMSTKGSNHIYEPIRKYTLRRVHSVQLTGLAPNTTYYMVAGNKDDGWSGERMFHTMPADDTSVTILQGGDSGRWEGFFPLLEQAAKRDVDAFLMGGDIAYANAIPACYRLWDHWFVLVDKYLHQHKKLVPLITAPGNHEIGGWLLQDQYTVPHYYNVLPYTELKEPTKRLSYHEHYFGDTLILSLDSGHDKPWGGAQLTWMKQVLETHKHRRNKMVMYHSPLYPSRKEFDWFAAVEGRKLWAPVFDEYNVTVAFEHHEHAFKRSKVLKNNKEASEGTVYLGDGAMGVPVRGDGERWYIAKFQQVHHCWFVQTSNSSVTFTAVDKEGKAFDTVTQPLR